MKLKMFFTVVMLVSLTANAQIRTYKKAKLEYTTEDNKIIEEQTIDVKINWTALTNSPFDIKDVDFKGESIRLLDLNLVHNSDDVQMYFTTGITDTRKFPEVMLIKKKGGNLLLFEIKKLQTVKIRLWVDLYSYQTK